MAKEITATLTVQYRTDHVLEELKNDYPDDSFDDEYATSMIKSWIRDDFPYHRDSIVIEEKEV
jgi:hypothetical protein